MKSKRGGSGPKLSGSKFPTVKMGPAPRPRGVPRMPAVDEGKALKPSEVFPTRSRSGALGAQYESDAVAVDDPRNYTQAEDVPLSGGGWVRRR